MVKMYSLLTGRTVAVNSSPSSSTRPGPLEQSIELLTQLRELVLQRTDSAHQGVAREFGRGRRRLTEAVLPPFLFLPGAALEPHDELAAGERVERLVHLRERAEAVQPLGARLQL